VAPASAAGAHSTSADKPAAEQPTNMEGRDREDGEMTPRLDETVLAGLMTIGQDDPAFVARIFGLFEQNAEPAMQKVQQACESNQHIELADAVHALKSMALNIGAARLPPPAPASRPKPVQAKPLIWALPAKPCPAI
jgi:HPt (histidine-containing phosphotransfer) domain-containing protein